MSRKYQAAQYATPYGGLIEGHVPNINVMAEGSGAPTASIPGMSVGCIYIRRDGSTSTAAYINVGSSTSATWQPLLPGGSSGSWVAGVFTTSLSVGGSLPTNPESTFAVVPGAVTATADQSYYRASIAPSAAVTIPTGTAAIVSSLSIAEPNITATGTVTAACTLYIKDAPTEGGLNYALWVDAGVSRFDGNLDLSSAATNIIFKSNTAAAGALTDGTTSLIAIDTRNTVSVQNIILTGPASQTLPDGATSRARIVSVPSRTITLAGQTQVTTANLGVQMFIDAPTIAQSGGAVTVDRASTLHVGTLVAGSSVTVTANHIISTDTSGCFCTAAGVWTDTACWGYGKKYIGSAVKKTRAAIDGIMEKITPKTWKYRNVVKAPYSGTEEKDFHIIRMNDEGRARVGIVYDDLPQELLAPGEKEAVSVGVLASFSLAALKVAWERIAQLESRLAAAGL